MEKVHVLEKPRATNKTGNDKATVAIPEYLEKKYWWAYVNPWARRFWDHPAQINAVLFGNYNRLRDHTLRHVPAGKNVIQLGSCYGNFITKLGQKSNKLTVVDCVPGQLGLAKSKYDCDTHLGDARDTGLESGSADIVMMFFLLHELPTAWKRDVLAEAYRLAGKNGKVVLTEFAKPAWWNPFGYLEKLIFKFFEPFAKESATWDWKPEIEENRFGNLYRIVETDVVSALNAQGPVLEAARIATDKLVSEAASKLFMNTGS